MTEQEALLILSPGNMALQDLYEDKLFEYKSFFLRWVPFSKVLESRRKSVERLELAFKTLGLETQTEELDFNADFKESSPFMHWKKFQELRLSLKQQMHHASSFSILLKIATYDLVLYRNYAFGFPEVQVEQGEIVISKEFDPMDLHQAFKLLAENDKTWKDIFDLDELNVLWLEMKRLNLWQKLEENGR